MKLYRVDITQATGLSKKLGQQRIEEWTDGTSDERHKKGTKNQEYRPATPNNNNEPQRKTILIDLDI